MTWWMWLIVGLGLFAGELVTPGGFFVIFFAVVRFAERDRDSIRR